MTVLEEIARIRKAEGDSLDYSIAVCAQAERTIPGWRVVNGRKGHMVTKIKLCAKHVKLEYSKEALKTTMQTTVTERTLLDGSKEKAAFHAYYIYVNELSKNNKGAIEGGAITFREDSNYADFVKKKHGAPRKIGRVSPLDGILDDRKA